jgi:glycosyltransferase involved in cell wall biosynthesis
VLVSIVMPVLNGMPWLPAAIASVRGQGRPTELIVCDGGSSDGSREWLERNADDRTRLVFERDGGQSEAIARGFSMASGDIWGWLNADDLFLPGALDAAVAAFEAHRSAPLVSGQCELIDGGGLVTGRIPMPPDGSRRTLLRHPTNLPQPATLFRADAYRAAGGLDLSLHYAMDVDLWLKLTRLGDGVLIDDVLAQFRIHAAAKTTRGADAMLREELRVRLRHGLSPFSATALSLGRACYVGPVKRRLRAAASRRRASD